MQKGIVADTIKLYLDAKVQVQKRDEALFFFN